ncbi:MAG: NAD(P)-dependent oxidoreductase [Gammaproteobacteria bacterium]|nr:NAD(P)-dependent oxidoreductase [Gammaproteobacteria bacterium]MDH4255456.1 NAD(P)-dependent oxidoreductase [Gammaproteobacteria bacterium]MDH5310567.1 NAD(P)-dependent oxidoreductase [Gammaproteobacteria bacterium]
MNIGFVGLGEMGTGIVPRLLAAGHRVTGWNRSADKAAGLIEQGMAWADSPAAVAAASEITFSCVTDSVAVRAIALGDGGIIEGLGENGLYLDMSTISPVISREIAAEFKARGRTMMDAPISGSPVTLAQGKASLMVGGSEADFERVKPALQAIGAKVTRIGEQGLAVQTKIGINLTLIVEMVAFCEGVALAEKGGVPRDVAVAAMLNSVVASPVMGYRGPFILDMPDKPLANVTLQQKDAILALELARQMGQPTPLLATANELLNACRGLGIDHRDFVTVYDVYCHLGGMSK